MEKGVEAEIASFENECTIDVDWASAEDIMPPAHYVEHWRLLLWDKAFRVYFDEKGEFKFTKGLNLMEFQEGPIAIKRVAYRYEWALVPFPGLTFNNEYLLEGWD